MSTAGAQRLLTRVAAGSILSGIGGFILHQGLYNVDAGERAVIWRRFGGGVQHEIVIGEGTHWATPYLTEPTIFDIKLRPRVIQTRTGTKDLQQVQISIRVLSKPEEAFLPWIYQQLGEDWEDKFVQSIATETLKAVVAQFDADQLLTQREAVSKKIREALSEHAQKDFHIQIADVSITHLLYSQEFTQAIEQKAVAQQEAERSKFIVMKAEQEREAAVILAEGESQAAELISKALAASGNGAIEVKRIDAARDIAGVLAGSRNVAYVPNSVNMLMGAPQARAIQQ